MLINIVSGLAEILSSLFDLVRAYEGEFDSAEMLENSLIEPNSCYIELSEGVPRNVSAFVKDVKATLYVITSHLSGEDNNAMYAKIEDVIKTLHRRDFDFGSCEFINFNRGIIISGLCVYTINFNVKE